MLQRLLAIPDRASRHDGRPFDPRTPFVPPGGRYRNWAHYGVMLPGLPEPYRAFGLMAIVGTPGVAVFANDWAIHTDPRDTAYVVSGTNGMPEPTFAAYSVRGQCELARGVARFGTDPWDWTLLTGSYPHFSLRRVRGDVTVDLELAATSTVSWFVDVPGVYQHWSLMCDCSGTITGPDGRVEIDVLGNLEYALGSGPNLLPDAVARRLTVPSTFFTYQVIDLGPDSQLLLTQLLFVGGGAYRTAFLRDRGGSHRVTEGIRCTVTDVDGPLPTPDGRSMPMARSWRWQVPAIGVDIRAEAHGDWRYGLGAGFVGSFAYTGSVDGWTVEGDGYVEYVDLR